MSGSLNTTPASMADPLLEVPIDLLDLMYAKPVLRSGVDLTTGVAGTGAFDQIMTSLSAYLATEYAKSRITGADYTKTFIELTSAALSTALQLTLGKDQAFWQAQQAQIAAITARVQLETAKIEHDTAAYNISTTLPAQTALINAQTAGQTDQNAILVYQLSSVLPAQVAQTTAEVALINAQELGAAYTVSSVMPAQVALTNAQVSQVDYQVSAVMPAQVALTSAQTSQASYQVSAVLPAQVALYNQQVTSYQKDAQVKAAKPFSDAWLTAKTLDDTLTPPTNFTNATIDEVMTAIRTANGL